MSLSRKRPRLSYVAIIEDGVSVRAIGPYLSMKRAEGLVAAWSNKKYPGYVLVIEKETDYLNDVVRQKE